MQGLMQGPGPATLAPPVAAEARKPPSPSGTAAPDGAGRGLIAAVEERFLVPTQVSGHARAWILGHAALSFPLSLRGPVAAFEAQAAQGPIRILCAGRAKRFPSLLTRWFGEVEPRGTGPSRSLVDPAELERLGADVVLAEVHGWLAERFHRRGWLVVPEVVRWRGALEHVPPSPASNSLRSDLRRIHRNGFVCEIGRTAGDWQTFAQDMVFPLARARFGDQVWIASPRFLRELARRGTLLFVVRGGRRIAGACVVPSGRRLWLPLIGVLGGDPALIADGAASAACAFTVEWARARGFTTLDWGRTSPFLNDGVQRYNRKWGLRPVLDPIAHHVGVWISPQRPEVRALCAHEPVLVRRGHDLAVHAAG